MKKRSLKLHPYAKLLILLLITIGIFVTRNLTLLIFSYVFTLFLIINSGQVLQYIRMIILVNLPFFLLLFLIYGFLLKHEDLETPVSGMLYASIISIRTIVLTSAWFYLLNTSSNQLLFFLKKVKLKGSLLIIIYSSFTLWKDFVLRADRIITARLARGALKNRKLLNRIRQIPYIIRPLLTSTLSMALIRTASWKQRKLLKEIEVINLSLIPDVAFSKPLSVVMPIIISVWFIVVLKTS